LERLRGVTKKQEEFERFSASTGREAIIYPRAMLAMKEYVNDRYGRYQHRLQEKATYHRLQNA
jgi:hypothetical protein